MKKFEVGKTYYSRSICNHECIFTIEVVFSGRIPQPGI